MTPSPISRTFGVFATAAASLLVLPIAQAHPGHPLSEVDLSHLLTSPNHLAVLGLAGATMVAVASLARHRSAKRALRCGGAVALFGAAAMWSLQV